MDGRIAREAGLRPDELPGKECLGPWVCSAKGSIPVPPGTCINVSSNQFPYFFSRNLTDLYDLSAGVYYNVPAAKFDANFCRVNVSRLDPAALRGRLKISIEQK
jgi:hypothetical protein